MKFVFKAIFLASFLLVSVLGFAAMGDGVGHCVASAMQGAVCPNNDLFGFASFHLNFFRNFSSAAFEMLAVGAVLLTLAVVLIFISLKSSGTFGFERTTIREIGAGGGGGGFTPLRKIRYWLSLLENSPSSSFALR